MTTLTTTFGELLVQLRRRAGMAQADLAAAVGYSRSLISALEQNRRQPEMAVIIERFVPALGLQAEPQLATRLVAVAAAARGERPPPLPTAVLSTPPPTEALTTVAPLPTPPTPLIGREQDVATIVNRFSGHSGRLLTLVGPPGVGKSRLALAVASRLQALFPDGARFIPLTTVTAADQLAPALLQALEVVEAGNQTPLTQLLRYLRQQRILLVLDNFEQIVSAAPLLGELLAACAGVHLLVTSRERLHLRAEQRYRVLPLELAAAVELFVQRAQAVDPTFVVTLTNQLTIAELCQRLDCLPLAIELVAAHAELFPPADLLQRLHNQRLDLLADGARDLPSQQRTLRHAIQSSYALLSEAEQRCFRALGVFVGSFDGQAVQALGFADEVLHALVNKNLVSVATQRSGGTRFVLLETIRHFCLEMLERQEELANVQAAYCTYFVAVAEEGAKGLQTPESLRWIEQFVTEQENLHNSLLHLLDGQQTALALRLGCALCSFWELRGLATEGSQWLAELFQLPNSADYPEQLAPIHFAAGILAEQQNQYTQARHHLEKVITLAQKIGKQRLVVGAYNQLGQALRSQGDFAQARQQHEQALQFARTTGDDALVAESLQLLGKIYSFGGDDEGAFPLLEEALALARNANDNLLLSSILFFLSTLAIHQLDYTTAQIYLEECFEFVNVLGDQLLIGYTLADMGLLLVARHDHKTALENIREGLKLFVKIEHHWGTARTLEYLTIVAAEQQQFSRVCTLAAAASALRRNTQTVADPPTLAKVEEAVNAAKAVLSEQAATAAWGGGEKMSLKEAVAYALTDDH